MHTPHINTKMKKAALVFMNHKIVGCNLLLTEKARLSPSPGTVRPYSFPCQIGGSSYFFIGLRTDIYGLIFDPF